MLGGEPRQILGIAEHELIAFGKFANIWIYRTRSDPNGRGPDDLLTNPLWSTSPKVVAERIGRPLIKEGYRGCFQEVKGEIDALIRWSYAPSPSSLSSRHGVIICEARTGEARNGAANSENLQHLLDKIQTVQRSEERR